MAHTNEDAVVLTTARPADEDQFLVVRHLPDRGTVEFGWWRQDEASTPMQMQVLELAAEAVEVQAFARLCQQVLDARWDTFGEGATIASAGPFGEEAELVALRTGEAVTLVRRPEPDNQIQMSRTALDLLVGQMPAAMQKLATLGFGLPQHDA